MLARLRAFISAWRDYPREKGELIGQRYEVLSRIGMGSYGLAYRCLDKLERRQVAVKQAKPSKRDTGKQMLKRERDILMQLDHPYIPACRDYFEEMGSAWLVTDYIEGYTLEQLIFEQGCIFGEKDTLRFVLSLMERVNHVHERGFVHLDLRIPNIILRGDDIYLIDFGLARRIGDESPSNDGEAERDKDGLPKRMPASKQSDLHDIGHLMLFMLYSGFTPTPGGGERSWSEELELTAGVRHILLRLLNEESNPYTETQEFIQDVQQALSDMDFRGRSH
ncbi:serine/threonine protein kinase [Paenibacillus sophorae]|uniref:Protein kinase n=1 Tax=Paenibacillus sophorae TaxID=1333845 RepID=A0A1H8N212_9BACL|nr:protein kinase [Paenibacillus sophorae]QWU14823.1 protein kinase [Paenibacillus sophorae]SEO23602.1 serine/threonine protein kinase [Paenibacillus sophorae]